MKIHLIFFAILIAGFISYNFFLKVEDGRLNTIINILYAGVLFGYIAFMAFALLKKIKK